MICTETFEVVEADETFLDLTIESREVILPLGSPSSDDKSPLRLDRDAFDKEGLDQDVCYMQQCFPKWPMRENELVTGLLTLRGKNAI